MIDYNFLQEAITIKKFNLNHRVPVEVYWKAEKFLKGTDFFEFLHGTMNSIIFIYTLNDYKNILKKYVFL